jgi:predicted AAA+ superfamily ATPase
MSNFDSRQKNPSTWRLWPPIPDTWKRRSCATSVNAVREDLQVSHKTVANWLRILERLYAIFRVSPFGAPRIRAVKKELKHYHWDWSLVPEPPTRFENLVASHLLKWVHYEQDVKGRDLDLRYFRDTAPALGLLASLV